MPNPLRTTLFAILGIIVAGELIWQHLGHFDVDMRAYGLLAAISLPFMLGSVLYEQIRKNPSIGSMLFGFGFLLIFAASANVMSYFGLTITGPRIDEPLAAIDRAMGVDWPGLMLFATSHPTFNSVLRFAYNISIYEALLLMLLWGWNDHRRSTEQICLTLVVGGLTTTIIWILAPSFGAFTIYTLPSSPAMKQALALNADYAHLLLNLWSHGPGHISPLTVKGLVGFPSFHAAQAIIATWYARRTKFLFYPFVIFNILTIISTPIQGGHHVVDVIGGFAVATFAIWLATLIANRVTAVKTSKEAVPALVAAG